MVSETNRSGLTLAMLKNRLEGFALPHTEPPTPNATQNNGIVSVAPKADSVELSNGNFEVLAFAKTAKGANEYIGALQTANVTLKKIDKIINEGADDALVNDLASKSSFMGNHLFDKNLVVSIGQQDFSLTLQNPASIDKESRLEYIASKRKDITNVLSEVNQAISSGVSIPNVPVNGAHYNFEEFDAAAFKKMF